MRKTLNIVVAVVLLAGIVGLSFLIWSWWKDLSSMADANRALDEKLAAAARGVVNLKPVEPPDKPDKPAGDVVVQPPGPIPATSTNKPAAVAAKPSKANGQKKPGVDVKPGEYVASFFDKGDRDKFVALAKAKGAEVLAVLDLGNSVLVRVKDDEMWRVIVKDAPPIVEQSPNYYVRVPDAPPDSSIKAGNYKPFGDRALEWLGVPKLNSGWGKGVTVAILDTGIQPNAGLPEENITRMTLEGNKAMSADDYAGHGTAVASLITGNTGSLPGMAPGISILNIKVMSTDGKGDTFSLASAIVEAADRGAKIINLCLGSRGDSFLVKQAVDYAIGKGIAIVAAAGNDGADSLSYPAQYEGVLAVAAIDASAQHLPFSNTGSQTAIATPGYKVTALWTNNVLVNFTGTSASVPFVSGAIAMLLSRNPQMSPIDAVNLICRYADDIEEPGRDAATGFGVMNLQRVIDKNIKGLVDVAVGIPFIRAPKAETNDITVVTFAQNRGNERVPGVDLKVDINEESYTVHFTDVAPCQTMSREFRVGYDKFKVAGALLISCKAEVQGATDSKPANNAIKTRLTLQPAAGE